MRGKPLPNGQPGPSLYCAVIVKRVDEQIRAKTSINELLRDSRLHIRSRAISCHQMKGRRMRWVDMFFSFRGRINRKTGGSEVSRSQWQRNA